MPKNEELYWVLKPIRYKNPEHELYRKRITPEMGMALAFPHLTEAQKKLLQVKRVLAPLTAKELKAHQDHIKKLADAEKKAKAAAEKAAAEELERQKKQAMEKQAKAKAEEAAEAEAKASKGGK